MFEERFLSPESCSQLLESLGHLDENLHKEKDLDELVPRSKRIQFTSNAVTSSGIPTHQGMPELVKYKTIVLSSLVFASFSNFFLVHISSLTHFFNSALVFSSAVLVRTRFFLVRTNRL